VVGPSGRRPLGRQKRLKALPLPIRQLVTCHIAEMGIRRRSGNPFADAP
jgi:hypothetical protein